jgi:hypothetical protein
MSQETCGKCELTASGAPFCMIATEAIPSVEETSRLFPAYFLIRTLESRISPMRVVRSGSRWLSMAASTSLANSASITAVESAGSNAMHSEMLRRGGAGEWITAIGSLPLSITTSAPARTRSSTSQSCWRLPFPRCGLHGRPWPDYTVIPLLQRARRTDMLISRGRFQIGRRIGVRPVCPRFIPPAHALCAVICLAGCERTSVCPPLSKENAGTTE